MSKLKEVHLVIVTKKDRGQYFKIFESRQDAEKFSRNEKQGDAEAKIVILAKDILFKTQIYD